MKQPKCSKCKNNPMGVCILTEKEVPLTYAMGKNKGAPKWCPLQGEEK